MEKIIRMMTAEIAKGQMQAKKITFNQYRQSETRQTKILPLPTPTSHSLLFIDTDMYVMKVWCELYSVNAINGSLTKSFPEIRFVPALQYPTYPWIKDETGGIS